MTAAQLGMEPNTPLGQAYLIPYENHGKEECQFQLGYRETVLWNYLNMGDAVLAVSLNFCAHARRILYSYYEIHYAG